MPDINLDNGFAIALAWPKTYCKQPGSWYDGITHALKISTNRFYQVGHAALILVDPKTHKCHYFDFGRYHAPFQYGRVRSEKTDPGLGIQTVAKISGDRSRIENLKEILSELQSKPEYHGDGEIHAGYCKIDFEKAFDKASQLQNASPLPYGPFAFQGSNCSRFVCSSILAGKPAFKFAFRLKYMVVLTPTPLNNVNALEHQMVVPKPFYQPVLRPAPFKSKHLLKTTIPEPGKHENIPEGAQWLSGEGAGSWFSIEKQTGCYEITRYNEAGEIECQATFREAQNTGFDINSPFQFVHMSHCQKVTILQYNKKISFVRVEAEAGKNSEDSQELCYA